MRKIIALALVGLFVVAPTALVTANGSWGEISRTLGEIHKTLGNISTLIGDDALEVEEKDISTLLSETNIPADFAEAFENTAEISSGRSEADIDISLTAWANNKSADMDVGLKINGAFDGEREKVSSDFVLDIGMDRDFTEVVSGDGGFSIGEPVNNLSVDISTLIDGEDAYFRLNKIPNIEMLDFLKKHENKWILSPAGELVDSLGGQGALEMGLALPGPSGNERELREFLKAYIKYPIFDFTKQSDVRIAGKWHSSYKLTLRTENVLDLSDTFGRALDPSYTPPTVAEKRTAERVLAKTDVDIVVAYDEQNSEIGRISLDLRSNIDRADLPEDQTKDSEMERLEIGVVAEIELSDLGQRIDFPTPVGPIPFEEVLWDLFDNMGQMISQEEDWDWSEADW